MTTRDNLLNKQAELTTMNRQLSYQIKQNTKTIKAINSLLRNEQLLFPDDAGLTALFAHLPDRKRIDEIGLPY